MIALGQQRLRLGIGEIGRLTQGGPEDAVVKGLVDFLVLAEGGCQGGLAEAAGTGEGGGHRHRILDLPLQQQSPQRLERLGALARSRSAGPAQ